jgi:hypothetical protein
LSQKQARKGAPRPRYAALLPTLSPRSTTHTQALPCHQPHTNRSGGAKLRGNVQDMPPFAGQSLYMRPGSGHHRPPSPAPRPQSVRQKPSVRAPPGATGGPTVHRSSRLRCLSEDADIPSHAKRLPLGDNGDAPDASLQLRHCGPKLVNELRGDGVARSGRTRTIRSTRPSRSTRIWDPNLPATSAS